MSTRHPIQRQLDQLTPEGSLHGRLAELSRLGHLDYKFRLAPSAGGTPPDVWGVLAELDARVDALEVTDAQTTPVTARAYRSAALTLDPGWQLLPVDTQTFDSDTGLNLGGGYYVIPHDGRYEVHVQAAVTLAGYTGASYCRAAIGIGGTRRSVGPPVPAPATGQPEPAATAGEVIDANAGDHLEAWVYYGQGGGPGTTALDVSAGSVTNFLSLARIGP